MASIRVVFPAPVWPQTTNTSSPVKSTSTGSRKQVKPSMRRLRGRVGRLLVQLVEQLEQRLRHRRALAHFVVTRQKLVGRQPAQRGALDRGRGVGALDADVDGVRQHLLHALEQLRHRAVRPHDDAQVVIAVVAALRLQLVERERYGAQGAAAADLDRADVRRLARVRVDDVHVLPLPALAEVELEQRATVERRRCGGDRLPLVHVPERDVLRGRREALRVDREVHADVQLALAPALADLAAVDQHVAREDVHGVGAEPGARGADVHLDRLAVGDARRVDALVERLELERHALGDPGYGRDRRDLAAVARGDAQRRGGLQRGSPDRIHARPVQHRCLRVHVLRRVVVAGEQEHLRAGTEHLVDRGPEQLRGVGRRRERVEHVAGNQHQVHALVAGDRGDLREHALELGLARAAADRAPEVPVARVQDAHQSRFPRSVAPARSAASSTSSRRVAQAGKGNCVSSGTGISGWCRNIVPGLRIEARAFAASVRKPYSPRDASAASSRPATRNDAFAVTRRSTSLAVCCAPIRITPRLRPRSAISRITSLIGLQPSRGAYLFSSSSTRNTSGCARPSFCSTSLRTTAPTTNRFTRSCRSLMSMTETWRFSPASCPSRMRTVCFCCASGVIARTRCPAVYCASCRRRTSAARVPSVSAGIACTRWVSMSSARSLKSRTDEPSGSNVRWPRASGPPITSGSSSQRSTARTADARRLVSLSPSANRKPNMRWRQKSASDHAYAVTPAARVEAECTSPLPGSLRTGDQMPTLWNGPTG